MIAATSNSSIIIPVFGLSLFTTSLLGGSFEDFDDISMFLFSLFPSPVQEVPGLLAVNGGAGRGFHGCLPLRADCARAVKGVGC